MGTSVPFGFSSVSIDINRLRKRLVDSKTAYDEGDVGGAVEGNTCLKTIGRQAGERSTIQKGRVSIELVAEFFSQRT